MNRKYFEDEYTELKKSTSELPAALEDIVAILNKHQKGILYFGIKDDGTVIGQQLGDSTLRDVTNRIHNKIEPRISPDVYVDKVDDKNIIVVEFSGNKVPYSADGRYFIRVGDESNKLNSAELDDLFKIHSNSRLSWEEEASKIGLDEIDEETLKEFIRKGNEKNRINYSYTNKLDILNKLDLIDNNGNIKNAGYILFGKNPKIELRCAIFATDTKTEFIDMKDYTGNIFKLIEEGENYIRKNIRWSANFNTGSFERANIPEIPLAPIREILCNSFCHRSWEDNFSNNIAIYSNRIEFDNPGHFTNEATPQDYIDKEEPSRPRNPLIAHIMYLSGEIEKWGYGIRKVYEICKKEGIKVAFEDRKLAFFVVLYRKNVDDLLENTKKDLRSINDKFTDLSKNEKIILQEIKKNPEITQLELKKITNISDRTISRIVNNLKAMKILKRIGSNKNGYWDLSC